MEKICVLSKRVGTEMNKPRVFDTFDEAMTVLKTEYMDTLRDAQSEMEEDDFEDLLADTLKEEDFDKVEESEFYTAIMFDEDWHEWRLDIFE